MIRPVKLVDAGKGILERDLAPINLLALAYHARNSSQSAHHPDRGGVGGSRQRPFDQMRVELIGFAVQVNIGTREICLEQRGTGFGGGGEQLIDEAILRASKRR